MADSDSTDPTGIQALLEEVRALLNCVARSLAERTDPGETDELQIDVEDERVTLKHAIVLLGAAMDAFDRSLS